MIELKEYQKQVVLEFEDYLKRVRRYREKDAHIAIFDTIQRETGSDKFYNVESGVDGPFVCIKIPTGGGKTIVACHLLNSIYQEYLRLERDTGIVMWLVPTDIIRTQTLAALKNPKHPYRHALDHFFSGQVLVYDLKEALSIKRVDVQENLCIMVATFSTFRILDTDGRKAFEQNGNLMEHFRNMSNANLLLDNNGNMTESLVNVIRMSKPVVILDEGHNATTNLSYGMLRDLNPCFIMEYTATPRRQSNILTNITGQQLKDEDMIKIPLYIHNVAQWQEAFRRGIEKRNFLESQAKKERRYIRPIALIQAEQEKRDPEKLHVQLIRKWLLEEKIPCDQIAIKTGNYDELRNIDLYSRKCEIRYIITVRALKEGWDNAFAYVLISVANSESAISVEQTIGRILRLPDQKRKRIEDLNCSYVFTSSRVYANAAASVERGLVGNGYTKNDFKILPSKITKENICKRAVCDDDIKIPCIAINDKKTHRLDFFADLLGSDFKLEPQDIPHDFKSHFDENRTQKIDIEKGDELARSIQTPLDVSYRAEDFDRDDLLKWLDKKIRLAEYAQPDKRNYLGRIIDHMTNKEKIPLHELSNNRHALRDTIHAHIHRLESDMAKQRFLQLEKSRKLSMTKTYSPDQVLETSSVSQEQFNLHLYERAGHMNKEELELAHRIDILPNIRWWYKNIEKRDFFMQGWKKSRFYPDFILKAKSSKIAIVEYKGEHLLTGEDTEYKKEIGKIWAILAGERYEFHLVDKSNVEQFVDHIAGL